MQTVGLEGVVSFLRRGSGLLLDAILGLGQHPQEVLVLARPVVAQVTGQPGRACLARRPLHVQRHEAGAAPRALVLLPHQLVDVGGMQCPLGPLAAGGCRFADFGGQRGGGVVQTCHLLQVQWGQAHQHKVRLQTPTPTMYTSTKSACKHPHPPCTPAQSPPANTPTHHVHQQKVCLQTHPPLMYTSTKSACKHTHPSCTPAHSLPANTPTHHVHQHKVCLQTHPPIMYTSTMSTCKHTHQSHFTYTILPHTHRSHFTYTIPPHTHQSHFTYTIPPHTHRSHFTYTIPPHTHTSPTPSHPTPTGHTSPTSLNLRPHQSREACTWSVESWRELTSTQQEKPLRSRQLHRLST